MDDVEELVIKPFREVVGKGRMAVENAIDSPDMLKEAQRLVKVGERGLTRIEASCKKLYADYSSNFVFALKENGRQTNYYASWRNNIQVAATQLLCLPRTTSLTNITVHLR
jgi:hypothetical protein